MSMDKDIRKRWTDGELTKLAMYDNDAYVDQALPWTLDEDFEEAFFDSNIRRCDRVFHNNECTKAHRGWSGKYAELLKELVDEMLLEKGERTLSVYTRSEYGELQHAFVLLNKRMAWYIGTKELY